MKESDGRLRRLAARLDSSESFRINFTELWMGGFFTQDTDPDVCMSDAAAAEIAQANADVMQRLLARELPFLVREIGASAEDSGVVQLSGSVDTKSPTYVTCPDIVLSIGSHDNCVMRLRANPCSPMSWTKVWLYVFKQDEGAGMSFAESVEFMAAAESVCSAVLDHVGAAIRADFAARPTGNLVTIYNFGSSSPVVKELVQTKSAKEWDSLADSVGSEPLVAMCDFLGELARDGAPGGLDAHPLDAMPQVPFVTSVVDIEDGTHAPHSGDTYMGLYTQRFYDDDEKVRISGIAAGESPDEWHRPAQPFALNYVVSL